MSEPEQCSPPVWPSSQRVNDGKNNIRPLWKICTRHSMLMLYFVSWLKEARAYKSKPGINRQIAPGSLWDPSPRWRNTASPHPGPIHTCCKGGTSIILFSDDWTSHCGETWIKIADSVHFRPDPAKNIWNPAKSHVYDRMRELILNLKGSG